MFCTFCLEYRLIFAASIRLSYCFRSSSPQPNFSFLHAMFLSLVDSGHISTSAIEFPSCFAPAISTINALKHETTRNPRLPHRPRKRRRILQRRFSSLTGTLLLSALVCKVLSRSTMCSRGTQVCINPFINVYFFYSRFICLIRVQI